MVGEMDCAVTSVDFDRMLNGLDRIYSEFARACGLSDCAYWMLVDISTADEDVAVSRLTSEWFYSKQTINSAIKTLTARGLATLEFAEGSRKNKVVCLTDEGRRFAEHYALPAVKAEQRAFGALEPWEQREIMRLVGKFSTCSTRSARRLNSRCPPRAKWKNKKRGRRATLNEVYEAVSRADCGDTVCAADR